jgi:hypothetical protein
LDLSKITAFQIFLSRPTKSEELIFEEAWLFGKDGVAAPLPFVDAFGQYIHEDWPGKLKEESEFAERRDAEAKALQDAPAPASHDSYGGWADGPKREATGWFRTEKIDGKWWLVTPEGRLFFSVGPDCVGTWQRTFVEGRDAWFAELPPREGDPLSAFYGYQKGAHSGADIINGEGATFGHYPANVMRKYGETWQEDWRVNTYARLQAWGFNTIANWSQADVVENSPMPYVVGTSIGGVRHVEGGTGYWAKMMDVFAPEFQEKADGAMAWAGGKHGKRPQCIGYYVDNELAWSGIIKGVLNSPLEQPARQAFIAQLQEQYTDIAGLNAAWVTEAADWDALRTPASNKTVQKDLDAFLYQFAKRYFEGVKAACRKSAPNQLYLGCRFAGRPPPAVEKACVETVDVVSYNLYYHYIPTHKWTGKDDLGKPIIIGEFHFGALDRGMFHTGLVAADSQAERAANYQRYIRSVADHPAFVGAHWFQYVDESITGRWFDGENYNIGFIDVTDTPYPEMVEAATAVHGELYSRRWQSGTGKNR